MGDSDGRHTVVFGPERETVMGDNKKLHNEQPHDTQYYSRDQMQVEKRKREKKTGSEAKNRM